jgi:hypothetical protein
MRRLIFHGSFLTSQKVTYAALPCISVSFSQFDEQFMGGRVAGGKKKKKN